MLGIRSCHVSPRGALRALFVVICVLLPCQSLLRAQLCTGTAPPCVLTAGYAGTASDPNFNKRENFNFWETTLSPASPPSNNQGKLLAVDISNLPTGASSNPIMAQPLYVAGISITGNNSCNPCNMVIAATLNGTVFAWVADGANAGTLLWSRKGTGGAQGSNALWADDCGGNGNPVNLGSSTVLPFLGILSTPVIAAPAVAPYTPNMYVTSYCVAPGPPAQREWWIHQIDLTTGLDVVVSGAEQHRRIGADFSSFTDAWQWQRSALLRVANSGTPNNLIYLAFGTGTYENDFSEPYSGWLVAYTANASGLATEFAYANQQAGSCGNGGGFVFSRNQKVNNGQCTSGNTGTPSCDCYIGGAGGNGPNWGGHGGGCWMSGNGPTATVANAIGSDGDVHVFLGCGNGGFQEFNGSTPDASNNYGQTVMDFRLYGGSGGFDSAPYQTFTPNSPAQGVAPPLPSGTCGWNGSTFGSCSYTVQTMNGYDYDQSVGGVMLFNDDNDPPNPRLLTIDKAGYGYLLSPGSLCAPGSMGTPCIGFATGDPGSWTFGAAQNLCTGSPDQCDRIPSMALTDKHASGDYYVRFLNYWPYNEVLTALQWSDNNSSTAQTGSGSLVADGTLTNALDLSASCITNKNCLTEQLVPGDVLALDTCNCPTGGCPTVTSVKDKQITLNITVTSAFGSCANTPQNFTFGGYFVFPAHSATGTTAGYPGAAVTVTEDCDPPLTQCQNFLVWAVAPDSNSKPNSIQRGLGTVYAFNALPDTNYQLDQVWQNPSSDVWCTSSFARPTVVNGHVFVPTYEVSVSGNTFSACPTAPGTGGAYASGILVYH